MKEMLSFKDFYNYIQEAECDSMGMHYLNNIDDYALHIYKTKNQVNINKKGDDGMMISIGNIIFDPEDEEVSLYCVKNGYCNYNNGFTMPWDTPIGKKDNNIPNWYGWFGPFGLSIKKLLAIILNG